MELYGEASEKEQARSTKRSTIYDYDVARVCSVTRQKGISSISQEVVKMSGSRKNIIYLDFN